MLKPGAWAHSPLKHRLPKIDPSVPVHFIFGDRDWMDSTVSWPVCMVLQLFVRGAGCAAVAYLPRGTAAVRAPVRENACSKYTPEYVHTL